MPKLTRVAYGLDPCVRFNNLATLFEKSRAIVRKKLTLSVASQLQIWSPKWDPGPQNPTSGPRNSRTS